jgi:hypothetical protein
VLVWKQGDVKRRNRPLFVKDVISKLRNSERHRSVSIFIWLSTDHPDIHTFSGKDWLNFVIQLQFLRVSTRKRSETFLFLYDWVLYIYVYEAHWISISINETHSTCLPYICYSLRFCLLFAQIKWNELVSSWWPLLYMKLRSVFICSFQINWEGVYMSWSVDVFNICNFLLKFLSVLVIVNDIWDKMILFLGSVSYL